MQEQLLEIWTKYRIIKWRIKTFRRRWKGFKYHPEAEMCPHCGSFLYPGDINEDDKVCCYYCKSTNLPKRFLKTVDVEVLKFGKAAIERVSKAAEMQGLSFLDFFMNPEFVHAYVGDHKEGDLPNG